MADRRWPARGVLLFGLAVGAYTLRAMLAVRPDWLGVDYLVYERAALAALRGEPFYAVPPEGFAFTFVYPPITVLAFAPFAVLPGWQAGFVAFTLTELAACGVLVWAVDGLAGERASLARSDHLLVGLFGAGSAAAVPSLFYGQVNPHVMAAIGVVLLALEADRRSLPAAVGTVDRRRLDAAAGALLGAAALFKLFPAALGAWFLRRRAWLAVATAGATGLGAVLAGLLVFGPDATLTYVDAAIVGRLESADYAGGMPAGAPYVTLRRPAAAIFPGRGLLVTLLPVLAVVPIVAALYRDCSSPRRRLLAAHVTVVGTLLVVPGYLVYLVFAYPTLLALCYRLRGAPRGLVLVGTALVGVAYAPATITDALADTGPPAVAEALLAVAGPVLSLGSPPLYGLVLSLAGCLLAARRSTGPPVRE